MARNLEKAQSMLHRFRLNQMEELGLTKRNHDQGLTDYELRDLNDEINHLFREKGQWERQIAALGGANYRSGAPRILDDHGEEIPGMRGYRYYGRARELPGVKEHLRPADTQENKEEVSLKEQRIKAYQGLLPTYFGNDDEQDGVLLQEENAMEELGWTEGWRRVAATLELPSDWAPPAIPRPQPELLC
ncbi:NineTeen Complex (NTC) component [Malassezia nana]|uniref:NineTeen Complex (NTC) component n=1 Tax=Malassezia nana TaxID=180528 RepID=A0AAF0J1S4_9BASI|nr:NineTeen Complex (NTC) component [Malassezia nana]